ncbi:MBL fold metallo-hydrolase [Candidatus Bathyarchaeota archaeon]|nr:MBL fold metallo-hydrolase [Candidatus Bathyarchaeota archaeon]
MLFKAIKSEIVSHISYIFSSKGEAAVVDPRRDIEIYNKVLAEWGSKLKYVFETHRNEDYIIGSIELSEKTGAKIIHGPGLPWKYGETYTDKDNFKVGSLKITALHTPGHSPDSSCYALTDNETGNYTIAVFTGDTLFVGDVGRTDFLGDENTPKMSGLLYDGLHEKVIPLGDGVIVYPGHGSGSVCGGKIAEREFSSIGAEKAMNPMFKVNREEFIKIKVTEKHEKSPYFKYMEKYNLEGPPSSKIPNPPALTPKEFKVAMEKGAKIIDTRSPASFGGAHITSSYSLVPNRLNNAGWVVDLNEEVLIVADDANNVEYAKINLYRMGYDNFAGYLSGGIESWCKEGYPIGKVNLIDVSNLKKMLDSKEKITVLDVRRYNEWDEGHIDVAKHIYLGRLPERLNEVPEDKPVITICKTGSRSSFASSILLRANRKKIYNVLGGMDAWKKSGYQLIY